MAITDLGALDFASVAGNAETALVDVALTRLLDDFRVDEGNDRFLGYADDDNPEGHADLRCSNAHAVVGIHALDHILGEFLDVGVDGPDALGFQAEDRVRGDSKRKYGQGAPLRREG